MIKTCPFNKDNICKECTMYLQFNYDKIDLITLKLKDDKYFKDEFVPFSYFEETLNNLDIKKVLFFICSFKLQHIDYLFPIYVLNAISASYITNSKEPISIYSQIQSFLDDIHYIV
ncbi:MAG: hypothetical protein A2015_02215 [Spirochaetes bacterium GWF1_31_7]|nr:MAG: hypothetical protein A2Y30_06065 [Spirochaetes bacterium GWE1_32_154]OHD50730.1 MAG: hypothetical protein A2015_02215 [Spirochaetes bacterium GWF1_31_7]HBD95067.1 hypothetical protein [Spirochaetia bacterium]HBI38047.1 hypothetical protein [Spirochaetia bacterium]